MVACVESVIWVWLSTEEIVAPAGTYAPATVMPLASDAVLAMPVTTAEPFVRLPVMSMPSMATDVPAGMPVPVMAAPAMMEAVLDTPVTTAEPFVRLPVTVNGASVPLTAHGWLP